MLSFKTTWVMPCKVFLLIFQLVLKWNGDEQCALAPLQCLWPDYATPMSSETAHQSSILPAMSRLKWFMALQQICIEFVFFFLSGGFSVCLVHPWLPHPHQDAIHPCYSHGKYDLTKFFISHSMALFLLLNCVHGDGTDWTVVHVGSKPLPWLFV